MTTVACGPFTLSSDFDSGNFLKAEYVQPTQVSQTASTSQYLYRSHSHDHEINIWTRPDCYGTRFENGNRTWFYFSIKGGKPQGTVKINVLNLNKQVKLFQQGMQPVYRVLPEKPGWERVQDKLLINETTEHVCSITFKQRLPDNPHTSILHIAFTYPFSYFELCEFLNEIDDQYLPRHNRLSPLTDLPLSPKSTDSDIYYHRECVCYSFERRRVELITVTSMYGISPVREERLMNLFPIANELRPFKFPEKKVVFMSARVHPGETPSSFVLNGFLRFILQPNDPRAVLLRRLFVFKFIPILNPDGVVRGHYRTDPRGVNLNRVYLNPSPVLHPPIYAARKLLLYYHHGYDCPDDYEYPVDVDPSEISNDVHMEEIKPSENIFNEDCSHSSSVLASGSDSVLAIPDDSVIKPTTSSTQQDNSRDNRDYNQNPTTTEAIKKPYTFVLSESNSLCAGCGPFIDPEGTEDAVMSVEDLQPSAGDVNATALNDSMLSHHQCAFEACDEDSVFYENLTLKKSSSVASTAVASEAPTGNQQERSPKRRNGSRSSSGRRKKKGGIKKERKKGSAPAAAGRSRKKLEEESSTSSNFFQVLPNSIKSSTIEIATSPRYKLRSKSTSNITVGNPVNYKISSPVAGPDSGLFLYLDMHGHTTKRGIFMYGNHFPEATTQAECMLLPRLMAVNSPHFDFSACNFTERLMCIKDKRDGASREGSGRVACLKLTGLIRSYTLECNYNTGRIVNHVVTRPPVHGFLDSPSSSSYIPPKFTINIFEGIGKALGESLLDLSGHNPWSRLGVTEFRSLDGVRRSIVKRLKLTPEYKNSGSDLSIKKQTSSGFETNPLLSTPPKVLKKLKTKVLVQPGGPLGPKRENQNLPAADAKGSGSQYRKKLPLSTAVVVECPPIAGCSSDATKEETAPTVSPPKISLKKVMKKKSLSKVPSNSSGGSSTGNKVNKLKVKKKKSKKSKSEKSSLEALTSTTK